jgi:hypothetical protein
MTVQSAAVTVTTTATALHAADADGQSIEVYNNSSVTVFWGGAGVTPSTGVPIPAGVPNTWTLGAGEVLYGVVASGTADCRVGRVSVG